MPEPRSLRHVAGSIAVALASLALVLGILEVAARLVRPRGGGKEEQTTARYTQYDPTLGWRKIPGSRATFHRREYTVDVAINSLGLRGPEHAYAAAPGTWRLVSLGDSFVEGQGVADEQTTTRLIESMLASPGCAVETINGGTIGYSTDQEYLFYREQGRRYAPQVVVLFFYYNDVVFTISERYYGRPKPLLVFRDGVPKLSRPPYQEPRVDAAAQAEGAAEAGGSALAAWVRGRLRRGAPGAYNALAKFGFWAPLRAVPPQREMLVYRTAAPRFVDQAWDKTAAILGALQHAVDADGARVLLVYVPSRMEVSDRDWELTRATYGLAEGEWDRALVRRRLAGIAQAAGLAFLDLTPALSREDHGALGGPYYEYDGHWNPRGHRIAADAIALALREREWLPSCAGAHVGAAR